MSNLKVRDSDNLPRYMSAYGDGDNVNPFITSHANFYLFASLGYIPNVSTIHKFGNAADIDLADGPSVIWDGTCDVLAGPKITQYTFSTTADITDIASTDDADTQIIEVQGLDTNWDLVIQNVTLTGKTVALLSTPLIRVFRMRNLDSTDITGTVYLTTSSAIRDVGGVPTDSTTVRAIIKDGDNQTQMAIYSVPRNYRLVITNGWSNMSRKIAAAAKVVIRTRDFGGVPRVVHTLALNSNGNSGDHRPYDIPIVFPPKSDLYYTADVTDNNCGVSSGFHGMLVPV